MDDIDIKHEIKQVRQLQKINYETLDCLRSQIYWLLDYCEATGITLPDFNKLLGLGRTSSEILDKLESYHSSDESLQGDKRRGTDDNLTEPDRTSNTQKKSTQTYNSN
jgi:hypothetical protein